VVSWTTQGKRSERFSVAKETAGSRSVPSWLSLDVATMSGRVQALPEVEEVGARFSPATIVENYSR